MATTTNYSWTTPDDTDLVKDGAAAIRTLGSSIDTTVFNNAGAAVAKSTIDAKGDLLVGTANDTVGRLGVGTDGFTLVADSVEATGLKWVAPSGGGQNTRFPSTTTGHFVNSFISGDDASSLALTEDVTFFVPIILPTTTLDRINIKTSASHSGDSTVRLGIYATAATNTPGALVLDAGTIVCNAASTNFAVTISQAVDAGLYFVAINVQSLTGTASFIGVANGNIWSTSLFGFSTATIGGANLMRFQQTSVSGALPSPAAITSLTAAIVPIASVRIG